MSRSSCMRKIRQQLVKQMADKSDAQKLRASDRHKEKYEKISGNQNGIQKKLSEKYEDTRPSSKIRIRPTKSKARKNRPEIALALQMQEASTISGKIALPKRINKKFERFKEDLSHHFLLDKPSNEILGQETTDDATSVDQHVDETIEKSKLPKAKLRLKKKRMTISNLADHPPQNPNKLLFQNPTRLRNKLPTSKRFDKFQRLGANSVKRNHNKTLEIDSIVLPEIPSNRKTPLKKLDKTLEFNRKIFHREQQNPLRIQRTKRTRKFSDIEEARKFEQLKLITGDTKPHPNIQKSSNMRLYGKDILNGRRGHRM
ncbi:unnamed protein product [Moneuplotes crassus]|uniref:Uncharacterized protein n=1 Tax=Euplotes crassus TaxID=5936 RepID=A0AAD2DAH2_EUPCR|nr:unnamed protein product [Moneuplotes crassus]